MMVFYCFLCQTKHGWNFYCAGILDINSGEELILKDQAAQQKDEEEERDGRYR